MDHVHFIIRSKNNRALKGEPGKSIHGKMANSPVRATFKIDITDRETRKKRKAVVELRYCRVRFELPYFNRFQKNLSPVTCWLVQAEEANPPKGVKPIRWILLTSKKVTGVSMAKTIVRYHEPGWLIERFHYILKSGAQVTQLQLSTPERVLNAVAAYSISAVNIMRINYLARVYPDWAIDRIGIPELEHRALYTYAHINIDGRLKFNPMHPPSMREFVIVIARLGGFTNFSNQPYPGLKVFWRGWKTFQTIVKSYQSFLSDE